MVTARDGRLVYLFVECERGRGWVIIYWALLGGKRVLGATLGADRAFFEVIARQLLSYCSHAV
jgi:hypothetical protein